MLFHSTCVCGACAESVQRLTAALEYLFERRGWNNAANAANKIARGCRYGTSEAITSIPRGFIVVNEADSSGVETRTELGKEPSVLPNHQSRSVWHTLCESGDHAVPNPSTGPVRVKRRAPGGIEKL